MLNSNLSELNVTYRLFYSSHYITRIILTTFRSTYMNSDFKLSCTSEPSNI